MFKKNGLCSALLTGQCSPTTGDSFIVVKYAVFSSSDLYDNLEKKSVDIYSRSQQF